MDREEQFKQIVERLSVQNADFQPIHLSVLMLMGDLDTMFQNGIIHENPTTISPSGLNAIAVAKELGWSPSDSEIATFCKEMCTKDQAGPFMMMLREMRDDPEAFIEKARKQVGY